MVLTQKQELFAVKYVECGNATEAYRIAYDCENMKPATVNRNAKKNTDNAKIATRIKELQAETADKLLVSDRSVLREYARIGFSDVRNLFNEDGSLKNIHSLDNDTARAISSLKVVTKSYGKGKVEYVNEIKFWNKNAALESLAKNLGLLDGNGGGNQGETYNVTYTVRKKVD